MKRTLSIRSKLIYLVLITCMLIYSITIAYLIINLKSSSLEDAKRLVEESIKTGAKEIEAELNLHMGVARSLAYVMSDFKNIPFEDRNQFYNPILSKTLDDNPNYIGTYFTMELSTYDPEWGNLSGRESKIFYKDKGTIHYNEIKHDVGGVKKRTGYHKVKDTMNEAIWEPYWCDSYSTEAGRVLETTLGVPIIIEGNFMGLAGIDIELSVFKELIAKIKPFNDGYAFLLSNEATYVAHPDPACIAVKFGEENPNEEQVYHISEKIKNGESFSFEAIHTDSNNDLYVKFVPVHIAGTTTPWSLGILVPIKSIMVSSNRIIKITLIAGFIGLLILFLVILNVSRSIIKPIKESVDFAQKISQGDLNAKLDFNSNDEIGSLAKHLMSMTEKFKDIVEQIKQSGNEINQASIKIYKNSDQLATGASSQVAATEEVSSSMEEMTANILQNTDNAQQTEKIAIVAAEGINRGSASTEVSVMSMRKIAEKITIINDIAFQTNILALNAAVEAARAGEHGKGFAVVAAEVRKLAERSKIASDEINQLSQEGVQTSEDAGTQLAEIVPEIEKTSKLVQEIASASLEQNSGADQINSAIQQLNKITQQNASASEEMATSSEELTRQADHLNQIVSFFKIGVNSNTYSNKNSLKQFKAENQNTRTNRNVKEFSSYNESIKGFDLKLNTNDNLDKDFESF